jgi:trigger factor
MEKTGRSFESLGKSREELQEMFQDDARDLVKSQLFLLAVADKEELSVEQQEIDAYLQSLAQSSGQQFDQIKNFYEQNNLMFALKDSIMADKAMELIYEKAEIKIIPPVVPSEEAKDQQQA